MDTQMYVPISLGIATLASLLMVVVGQIMTMLKIGKLKHCCPETTIAGAASSSGGWFKAAWEFVKLVAGKVKDKFKDKAADKIADETVETTTQVAATVVAEEAPKKV